MNFFEFSVAFKYLKPRWRQLSVSIISLISILVISLVVWLIVVFFSVTHGLEKNWIEKLIALTSPIRVTPTQEYYDSYYYLIDSLSDSSDYTLKSIEEKLNSSTTDPYDPTFDEEIPQNWLIPDLQENGELKDIVKLTFEEIKKIPDISVSHYEMSYANLQLRLLREPQKNYASEIGLETLQNHSILTQDVYIASYDQTNDLLKKTFLDIKENDIKNLLNTLSLSQDSDSKGLIERSNNNESIFALLDEIEINKLQTPSQGLNLPKSFFPENSSLDCCAVIEQDYIKKIIIPSKTASLFDLKEKASSQGLNVILGKLNFQKGKFSFSNSIYSKNLSLHIPFVLENGIHFNASLSENIPSMINRGHQLLFDASIKIQSQNFVGKLPFQDLILSSFQTKGSFNKNSPLWIHYLKKDRSLQADIPSNSQFGEGILLPKSFRDAGILIGDRGHLTYKTPTASTLQEQKIAVTVVGFYDPGIIPLGGKLILANKDLTSMIRLSQPNQESSLTNGINIRFDDLSRTDEIKKQLLDSFKKAKVDQYWQVQTFKEYEFTKDIIQQLNSEKNLFTMLAIVIIVVACSNIISMLIILVNDKKVEIGILRSMGASSKSIASIFAMCGICMGLIGSVVGIILAKITLTNLQSIIHLLSRLQGHEMFNPAFYGEILPNELSIHALGFVIIMTIVISTIAGIVPAVKACLIRPSEILRAE